MWASLKNKTFYLVLEIKNLDSQVTYPFFLYFFFFLRIIHILLVLLIIIRANISDILIAEYSLVFVILFIVIDRTA